MSFDAQLLYVTMAATSLFGASAVGDGRRRTMCPNSLQRKLIGGPSCDAMFVFETVSNSGTPGVAEQSSSFVSMTIARFASARRKP